MKHLIIILSLFVAGCAEYEPVKVPTPVATDTITPNIPDTCSRKVIAGWGYGNPYILLWRDLNSLWVDTFYQGILFFKDTLWVPRMEWGELRIQSTDSVYLRMGCIQGWSVKAISFKILN